MVLLPIVSCHELPVFDAISPIACTESAANDDVLLKHQRDFAQVCSRYREPGGFARSLGVKVNQNLTLTP